MIVVTTPTGTIGKQVTAKLLAAGQPVRVIVRSAARLDGQTRERACIVEGSHSDPATLDMALNGADALLWVAPVQPQKTLEEIYLDFTRPAAEALAAHGVSQVVAVAALGRGSAWEKRAGIASALLGMEDVLMSGKAAFRGLALPSFMDNLLRQAAVIKNKGMFFGTADPDQPEPLIAARDIGTAAAQILADRTWTGQEEIRTVGPDNLSANEMAEAMSEALGHRVRYTQIPFEVLKDQQLAQGASKSFAQGFVDMLRAKSEGMDRAPRNGAAIETETPFRSWCEHVLKPAIA